MRDTDLLRPLVVVAATNPARVHHVHLEVGHRLEELEEAIPLHGVVVEEERVGPRDAQVLARLGGAAGRGALGLAEHEVRGRLLPAQTRHSRDDVLVAIEQ